MTDLFHELPTQTRHSFAAMNTANAAEAVLIKSRIKEKSVLSAAKKSIVVARAPVKSYFLKESGYEALQLKSLFHAFVTVFSLDRAQATILEILNFAWATDR